MFDVGGVVPERFRARLYEAAFRVPPALRRRWIPTSPSILQAVEEALRRHYFTAEPAAQDLQDHLETRLRIARCRKIPWINAALPLDGARVLEIGCGTGSSTLALAEQGARVTSIDVEQSDAAVAQIRCRLYGVPSDVRVLNASELASTFTAESFDLVLFYASLEHMTPTERTRSLQAAWQLLRPGGFLCVVDTPNRLWPYDRHTSKLPFFNWLPDDLAYQYAARSPRADYREACAQPADAHAMQRFHRWGRGVSFHDFELALGDLDYAQLAPGLFERERRRNPLLWARWALSERATFRALRSHAAHLPALFFEPGIALLLAKQSR